MRALKTGPVYLASLSVDHQDKLPLHRQLYFGLREAILDGRLSPGTRLPSSRSLAKDLEVSRNTVLSAFEQLFAEGYIEGKIGAGSFVSKQLPEEALQARSASSVSASSSYKAPGPSKRGQALKALKSGSATAKAFSPGLPELAQFPFEAWARLLQRYWRNPPASFLIGSDPKGYAPLRRAIADHLGAARAVRCSPDQVFIVSGAQQAIDLTVRVLLDPGDKVWVEEPGYPGLIGALIVAGADIERVSVDQEGMVIAEGIKSTPFARMACVSPSHQFPTGCTMSLKRRIELLAWARENDAFVLEDDYDSEYRYAGRPLAALQGLDADGRVVYVGTMSKVMFPGLRLGYMVVPEHMIDDFIAIRRHLDTHPPTLAQPALAEFIVDGSLSAHIRRMRSLYASRQEILLSQLSQKLKGKLEARPSEAGMHLVARLVGQIDDAAISDKIRKMGVETSPLSWFYGGKAGMQGLLLGYAGIAEPEIVRATGQMVKAFDQFVSG